MKYIAEKKSVEVSTKFWPFATALILMTKLDLRHYLISNGAYNSKSPWDTEQGNTGHFGHFSRDSIFKLDQHHFKIQCSFLLLPS